MYNKTLYNKIMKDVSFIIRKRLNEDVFSDGRYDRWKTSTPYDDEYIDDENPVIDIDIIDVLNGSVVDDNECERLVNICKKSGIQEDTTVEVVIDQNTYEIITDEQLQEALSRIKNQKYQNIIKQYIYDEIDRQLEYNKNFGFDDENYKERQKKINKLNQNIGMRDSYYDSLRKKSLGEKYKFKK